MCMHINLIPMRSTIEITDAQRSKLLAMAAARGMKGFSTLVQQALDEYLKKSELDESRIKKALASMGALDDDEARELAERCASTRENWR